MDQISNEAQDLSLRLQAAERTAADATLAAKEAEAKLTSAQV